MFVYYFVLYRLSFRLGMESSKASVAGVCWASIPILVGRSHLGCCLVVGVWILVSMVLARLVAFLRES